VNIEKEMSLNVIKQLKSNKTLKATLDDAETKNAFISALKNFVSELESNK
jgi:TusA-related sulfurtransferase